MSNIFADKVRMQNRLFSELSTMFGREVPLYDKSLLVNRECNKTICELLEIAYEGFSISESELEKTSGERHGAIRIGRPDEYRWVTGFFAAFGMEPHNFYDMTNVGAKSQPIIATAFRSRMHPEHRVFCSLLMTNYFDSRTRERIESSLSKRQVFSERAKELVLKNEKDGGLSEIEAEALIHEGVSGIFKWTGKARDFALYQELSKAGFKIAADITCFESHHLNHLTPNTLWMDLYTCAMKFCLGELKASSLSEQIRDALKRLAEFADGDFMKLHFKHLTAEKIGSFGKRTVPDRAIADLSDKLQSRLQQPDCDLSGFKHSGFKDFTEGPPSETPILLRQDAYKALTESVTFYGEDGSKVEAAHTARFGEIEQRFYATTPKGRALYDRCLAAAEKIKEEQPNLVKNDFKGYQRLYAQCFSAFPKTLSGLLQEKLVYGRYFATPQGREAAATEGLRNANLEELLRLGYIRVEGLRYEDFLPISAAGIFASNLGQYGTKSTADERPVYLQEDLEKVMGRKVVDANEAYAAMEEESLKVAFADLGLADVRRK